MEIEYVYARVADVCGAFTVGTRTRRATSSWRITSRRCSRAASDRQKRTRDDGMGRFLAAYRGKKGLATMYEGASTLSF